MERNKAVNPRSAQSEKFMQLSKLKKQGRNWVNLRGGAAKFVLGRMEIIHGLSPGVKCVAPIFRDMSLAKM